jgi:hypothetical protein
MSDAVPTSPLQFDGVVNNDGSVTVPSEQVASLHLAPGSHLRLVPAAAKPSIDRILKRHAAWQEAHGIEISEEEAERRAITDIPHANQQ